jgi:hypothetical protein
MLLTTCIAFMPSLKAHRAEIIYKELGAGMGRKARQEMGHMGACVLGGLAMQNGEELAA